MKLVTFRINEELYGLAVDSVRSIERVLPIRPVPHAPQNIVGIMNLRGIVMTVADLRTILNSPQLDFTADTRFLVVGNTAYIVDEALDVLDVSESQIELPDESHQELVLGVVQHDSRLIVILNHEFLATAA